MRFFSNKRKSDGVVAISLSDTGAVSVRVNSAAKTGGKPFVASITSLHENLLKSPLKVAGALSKYAGRNDYMVLLNPREYQLIQTERPDVPIEELKQAVSWKIQEFIKFPTEQATIDIIDIPSDNRQPNVYVVAAENKTISGYMSLLHNLPSPGLSIIDITELAQSNIANKLEVNGNGVALFSITGNDGLLTFTQGGNLYHSRSIEIDGYGLNQPDTRAAIFERLTLEIQRSLDSFERNYPSIYIKQLILAPFEGRLALLPHLAENLYLPVSPFDLVDIFDFNEGDKGKIESLDFQSKILPSLGLTLREIG